MDKWEYLVESYFFNLYEVQSLSQWLNEHGSKGWELVTTHQNSDVLQCFFKRKIQQENGNKS